MGHQLYMDALTMPREQVWQDQANCRDADPVIFEIIDEDHPAGSGLSFNEKVALTNENFAEAEDYCLSCPVMTECWDASTMDDREWSYRAGRYPSRFSGKMRGRPKGATSSNPDYVKEVRCNRGHIRLKTVAKCNQCQEYNRRKRKDLAEGVAVETETL